ncbi:hypothetical protein SCHPADRAFT_832036 [Schizopora paradoxa]|uniref:Phosphatidylglycerol/phosphatidylinositol transfer protein n=1 Tax=Schizopora paradoxa TaxID=27342 RepID=A0A0H2S184_9AGAM|nr:hypothetical protein SCHPADRAFT_832036 [Schizopora paradoxa]
MKLLLSSLAFISTALAQRVAITYPNLGQNIPAGSSINVQVAEGLQLSSITEVGIAVTLQHCQQNPCEDVSNDLGIVFYSGPYQNQEFTPPSAPGWPYQNFTVNVPSGFQKGPAVFSVAHAQLVGAGPEFFNEIENVTVNII